MKPSWHVPFDQPLWQPERVRADNNREDRLRLLDALENKAPDGLNRLRIEDVEEIRPGYLARVRAKIAPPQQEEPAEPMRQLYRIVGEKR